MALGISAVQTDQYGREIVAHGAPGFPIGAYQADFQFDLVPWHWHEEFETVIITEGISHVHVENAIVPLKAGDMMFINSGILHCLNNGIPEQACGRSLVFHPRLLGAVDSIFWKDYVTPILQDKLFRFQHFSAEIPWQKEFIDHARAAWVSVACEPADYENEARYHMTKAMYLLKENHRVSDESISTHESIAAERTKLMLQFIQDHYTEELTLEQIAASAAASKSMCLRYFRQTIGTTPIRYLIQYRIEKAAEMLLSTGKKAGEIALACGFSDMSYFTRRFREIKGCTPLEYRKENS